MNLKSSMSESDIKAIVGEALSRIGTAIQDSLPPGLDKREIDNLVLNILLNFVGSYFAHVICYEKKEMILNDFINKVDIIWETINAQEMETH